MSDQQGNLSKQITDIQDTGENIYLNGKASGSYFNVCIDSLITYLKKVSNILQIFFFIKYM